MTTGNLRRIPSSLQKMSINNILFPSLANLTPYSPHPPYTLSDNTSSRDREEIKRVNSEGFSDSEKLTHSFTDKADGAYIVRICTFNLNGKFNGNEIYERWLTSDINPDIIAVGFQELYFKLKDVIAPNSIFQSKIAIEPHRRWIDFLSNLKCIKDNYTLLLSKSFAGLCMFIYIRKKKANNNNIHLVSNLLVGTVPVGMLGMANKGALSIAFQFEEMSVCFINCHLPAGANNHDKRQNSMQAVIQRLELYSNKNTPENRVNFLDIEFDVVYLFGDLNFRLQNISAKSAVEMIEKDNVNCIKELLKLDELLNVRETDALYQCFNEGNITFLPTYKFLIDTQKYTGKRVPSYCDRILWMGSMCLNLTYKSHPDFTVSDHKPVSADFLVDLGKSTQKIYKRIPQSQSAPRVRVSDTVVDFGDVRFLENNNREIYVINAGKTKVNVTFKSIRKNLSIPSWLAILPINFELDPKTKRNIQFRIFIDFQNVTKFNSNIEIINAKHVCVSILNGISIPLTFSGYYHVNVFGLPLSLLKHINKPIKYFTAPDIAKLEISYKQTRMIFNSNDFLNKILNVLMPKVELTQSFSYLIQEQISVQSDVLTIVQRVNDVDPSSKQGVSEGNIFHISTQLETILLFMKSLHQPLISFVFQARLTMNPTDRNHISNILSNMPKPNTIFLKRLTYYFHDLVKSHRDLDLIAHFVVTCLPPSSNILVDPLISVFTILIQKPGLIWKKP